MPSEMMVVVCVVVLCCGDWVIVFPCVVMMVVRRLSPHFFVALSISLVTAVSMFSCVERRWVRVLISVVR